MIQSNFSINQSKAYQHLTDLCRFTYQDPAWQESFWSRLCCNPSIYKEWEYYITHHNFKGSYQICGYSVIDVLIWQVNHAPLPSDWRMEDPQCYRAYLVLYSFDFFLDMARKPEEHVQMLESGKSQEYF